MQNHAAVEIGNPDAGALHKYKWQEGVQQAAYGGSKKRCGKRHGREPVLAPGFADTGGMVCEEGSGIGHKHLHNAKNPIVALYYHSNLLLFSLVCIHIGYIQSLVGEF